MKKKKVLTIILICISSFQIIGQTERTSGFIGLNPSVTVEPFYKEREFDVNVFPLVFQKTLTRRIDFRLSTTLNYGIRNTTNEISHLGGQFSFPVFIRKKSDMLLSSQGFFLAPGIGVTRNRIEKHTNFGLWVEPGYNLMISKKWSISFGVQLGATHFDYDSDIKKWGNHFGIKIIIGKWI